MQLVVYVPLVESFLKEKPGTDEMSWLCRLPFFWWLFFWSL